MMRAMVALAVVRRGRTQNELMGGVKNKGVTMPRLRCYRSHDAQALSPGDGVESSVFGF